MEGLRLCICCRKTKKKTDFPTQKARVCDECHISGKAEERQAKLTEDRPYNNKYKGKFVVYPWECQLCKKIVDIEGTFSLDVGSKTFVVCHSCMMKPDLSKVKPDRSNPNVENSWFKNEEF